MTKFDIVARIAGQTGMEQQQVKAIVQLTLDRIFDAIVMDGRLELREFGVFEVHVTAPRAARNPRTGAPVNVPAGKRVRFKPGRVMLLRVQSTPAASGADLFAS
jgi:nucleoid DNA-binding protein